MRAVIHCDSEVGGLRVAALTVLERLLVACARAGCREIQMVCAGEPPVLRRVKALGIGFEVVKEAAAMDGPVLLADASLLVLKGDAERVIQAGGRLTDAAGHALPFGVSDKGIPESLKGGRQVSALLADRRGVAAEGPAVRVTDAASARAAEKALWASMNSSTDGLVDRSFNRPCGRLLSRVLIHTPVTPNQVSVFSILLGVAAGACFAAGPLEIAIAGALLLQLSAVVDCVDGELARIAFKESRFGKWLDLGGDQLVHVALFSGIGIGLWRIGADAPVIPLAVSAVIGALISFAVVVRGMTLPPERQNRRLQELIDKATNRDFSVLLLALTVFDQREWFLWMLGIGVHAFWVAAWAIQMLPAPRKEEG